MTIIYIIGSFLISGLLFVSRKKFVHHLLISLFLILQWVLTCYEFVFRNRVEFELFNPDALAILLLITLSIIAVPALYHSYVYLEKNGDKPREKSIFYGAMTILISAMSAAYLSSHITVTWIFVEITTLAASALIYHRRNPRSLEGTWKYIFVCSISLTFVFVGILFLSIALQQQGSTDLSFSALFDKAPTFNVFWLRLAFIFIFTGYSAKLSLVPMYTAGIDAKDKAPSPASALLSSALINVGFVGIFRFYEIVAQTTIHSWVNHVILIAACLSIFVSTVYMLKVKNIKRMFAYSSVEHMGIVMLGIAAGGVGYYAAILHIILHSFVKSSLFFQVGQIFRVYRSKNMYDIGNYFKYNLTGAIVMLLGFFCATAMPPSGLFISEFMIFRSVFEAHHIVILILVFLLLTTIIWAFGKNIFKLLFTAPVGFNEEGFEKIHGVESISQFVLLGLVIYLGLNPPVQMVELINEAMKNLPN